MASQLKDIAASLRERVSQIDTELANLDALREERGRVLAAIEALERGGSPNARRKSSRRGATTVGSGGRSRGRGETQTAVLGYLAEHPGSSASVIANALGLKRNSTSTRLTQMAKAGLIVRSEGRGYELPAGSS